MIKHNRWGKIRFILYIILVISLLVTFFFFKHIQNEYNSITIFKECADAGYQILTTYPEQCKIPGKVFINDEQIVSTSTKEDIITFPERNMNPKNTSYDIEGESVTLQNGKGEIINTNGDISIKNTVQYFGNELRVDLNDDGKEDTAFLLTTSNSGSGTFYYLVVALNKNGQYNGTNGVFIGDRIAPQTTEFRNGEIVVNYADRRPSEPMSTKPSVGVSRYFKVDNNTLIEIIK